VNTVEISKRASQQRIRTALKWAQDVLWEWRPEADGPGNDRALAALLIIFRDAELIKASDASRDRLGKAVREIRAILARRNGSALRSSRQIIDELLGESALDANWLCDALGSSSDAVERGSHPTSEDQRDAPKIARAGRDSLAAAA
jgi:hypothetical protein